jgi:hypothetical protein
MEKYRFIKDGSGQRPRNISAASYNIANYGDLLPVYEPVDIPLTGYLYSGSQSYNSEQYRKIISLKNTVNYHFPEGQYEQVLEKPLSLVALNSLHLAGGIQRGSVNAAIFYTGSLIDTATDSKENGILYNKIGQEVGFVLYKEGFFFFTGSQVLVNSSSDIGVTGVSGPTNSDAYRWHHFMASSSYDLSASLTYQAVNITPTYMTFIYANKLELNHSNNPTYIKSGSYSPISSSNYFIENMSTEGESILEVKNIVQSPFTSASAPPEKQTYISKIGLYDKDKKLIASAHLANPLLKTANREFLFKLKLDL